MLKAVFAILMIGGTAASAQNPTTSGSGGKIDRAAAYYYYAIAHMYAEKAASSGNQADVAKAIENFEAAVKADPSVPVTPEELSGIYKKRIVTLTPIRPPAASPSSK